MSKIKVKDKEKIHVDDLFEKADEWWAGYTQIYLVQDVIIREYMKAHNLKNRDILW